MSVIPVLGREIKLDTESIKQIDIRREVDQVVIEISMHGEKHSRRYIFGSYEDGINFYRAVWEQREKRRTRSPCADAPRLSPGATTLRGAPVNRRG